MSQEKDLYTTLVRAALGLATLAGLWLLTSWLIAGSPLSASEALLEPLAFRSPIGDPRLSIDKTADLPVPQPGDELIYTLAYSNTNDGSQAFNVRLYDFLPAGVDFLSASPAPDLVDNGVLVFTADSVGPGTENNYVTVRVRVREGYESLYNHTLVSADGITPTYASLLSPVFQPLVTPVVTKTGPSAVLVGGELVYTLQCENTTAQTMEDVTIVDVLPTGVSFASASPSPDAIMPPTLQWSVGELAPGEMWEAMITTTAPSAAGFITNTALADTSQGVMTQSLLSTNVVTQGAILQVTKSASEPAVRIGDQLVYTIRYWNDGNQVATGVTMTDTLPNDVTADAADPPWDVLTPDQATWNLGTLDPGVEGQVVLTVTVGGSAPRTIRNVVDVVAQPGSFPGHAERSTQVENLTLFLPVVMKH